MLNTPISSSRSLCLHMRWCVLLSIIIRIIIRKKKKNNNNIIIIIIITISVVVVTLSSSCELVTCRAKLLLSMELHITTYRRTISNSARSMQELLLRLVEDHYPLPSNPSQPHPSQSHPSSSHPAGANGVPSKAEAAAAARLDKKRKSSKAPDEVSPKSRRTKRSIKASKGVAEGLQVKSELEDEAYAGGKNVHIQA